MVGEVQSGIISVPFPTAAEGSRAAVEEEPSHQWLLVT